MTFLKMNHVYAWLEKKTCRQENGTFHLGRLLLSVPYGPEPTNGHVEVGEAPSCTARTWHLPSGIGPIRSRVSVYTSGLYWARFLFVFLGLSN